MSIASWMVDEGWSDEMGDKLGQTFTEYILSGLDRDDEDELFEDDSCKQEAAADDDDSYLKFGNILQSKFCYCVEMNIIESKDDENGSFNKVEGDMNNKIVDKKRGAVHFNEDQEVTPSNKRPHRGHGKKRYYAVRKGRIPGIYDSWTLASEQVLKFSGCEFRGFNDKTQAETYLATGRTG
jgi:hypothetical protein